jgi:hypothetical protein
VVAVYVEGKFVRAAETLKTFNTDAEGVASVPFMSSKSRPVFTSTTYA